MISSKTSLGCYDRSASNDNYSKKNNKITKSVYFAENNCKQSNLSAVDNERKLSINHHLSLSCEFNLLFVP